MFIQDFIFFITQDSEVRSYLCTLANIILVTQVCVFSAGENLLPENEDITTC